MQDIRDSSDEMVAGRNPVIELLRSERPVNKILMLKTESGSLKRVIAMAKERGVPVKDVAREKLDALSPGVNHQGVIAFAAACDYATVDDIFTRAGSEPLFVVIADGIEDPHNLGAIIRSADAAGAHGVIVPKRHGAGLTAAVMKASAGAAEHLPVARVSNLAATVEELKKKNVWVYAADMDGESWCTVDYSGAVALVIGSEGSGVSRLLKERSDVVVSLPMCGKVNSLNASVAAGILLYEITRQRKGIKAK
ncbi:23S rRNA (guanosine(2251)-2'-O)-methyltransferase RlmB [Oscillospiraceae bacterium LTW-04]|nr:23S rRNA (guanosine(2251)-2'-O)-methyltransferase RlmB [Oscillospiraceae bacterium MB24-C1]